ncbi:hypothetical protein NL676_010044 [Syzygium grande]|nr:hypothetical protein NL676_010044 [Syzygium grande]
MRAHAHGDEVKGEHGSAMAGGHRFCHGDGTESDGGRSPRYFSGKNGPDKGQLEQRPGTSSYVIKLTDKRQP